MFEKDRYYTFRFWKPGPNGGEITTSITHQILEENLPCIRAWNVVEGEVIINVGSAVFVSAHPRDDREPEE